MRTLLGFIAATAILATPLFAQSKGDWNVVRGIEAGRLITIKAQRKIRCEFVDATDDKLFCDREVPFSSPDRLAIDRGQIREVRLELTDESNAMVNACIGGATGLVIGAIANAAHPDSGTDARPLLLLMGALMGGHSRHAHLVHGAVIYKH